MNYFLSEQTWRVISRNCRKIWEGRGRCGLSGANRAYVCFYALIGKKEDMLDKEKVEAYAARVKYDSAVPGNGVSWTMISDILK